MARPLRKIPKLILKRQLCRVIFISWFIALFALSSIPGKAEAQLQILFADKVAHLIFFAVGSAAFTLTLTQHPWRKHSSSFLFGACMIMTSVVGGYDEWHQTFTPNRDGNSPGDLVANLGGGVIGYCAGLWCKGKFIISSHHLARNQ